MLEVLDLNHVAIHVADLTETKRFYGEILGFPEKNRPDFDFPGVWYALGPVRELHVIAGRTEAVVSASRGAHFAMEVKDIEVVTSFLKNRNIPHAGPKNRPDGVPQVFLQDPDGYTLEFTQIIN